MPLWRVCGATRTEPYIFIKTISTGSLIIKYCWSLAWPNHNAHISYNLHAKQNATQRISLLCGKMHTVKLNETRNLQVKLHCTWQRHKQTTSPTNHQSPLCTFFKTHNNIYCHHGSISYRKVSHECAKHTWKNTHWNNKTMHSNTTTHICLNQTNTSDRQNMVCFANGT